MHTQFTELEGLNPINFLWIDQVCFVSDMRMVRNARMRGYRARYGRIVYAVRKISDSLYMVTRTA